MCGYSLSKIMAELNLKASNKQVLPAGNLSKYKSNSSKMTNNYGKNLNLTNKQSQKDLLETLMNSEKADGDFF